MKRFESNLLEDLIYSIMDNEREPKNPPEPEPELPEDVKLLENMKRARYEALKQKYKD